MSEMKTVESDQDVNAFLNCVENSRRAADARIVADMMERITGCPPKMWGDSIIGFDRYTYKRRDGSEHQYMITGLSPRKSSLTIYIMPGFSEYGDLLKKLGKHKHSVSCLYITQLRNIDLDVLETLISDSVKTMRERYRALA